MNNQFSLPLHRPAPATQPPRPATPPLTATPHGGTQPPSTQPPRPGMPTAPKSQWHAAVQKHSAHINSHWVLRIPVLGPILRGFLGIEGTHGALNDAAEKMHAEMTALEKQMAEKRKTFQDATQGHHDSAMRRLNMVGYGIIAITLLLALFFALPVVGGLFAGIGKGTPPQAAQPPNAAPIAPLVVPTGAPTRQLSIGAPPALPTPTLLFKVVPTKAPAIVAPPTLAITVPKTTPVPVAPATAPKSVGPTSQTYPCLVTKPGTEPNFTVRFGPNSTGAFQTTNKGALSYPGLDKLIKWEAASSHIVALPGAPTCQ